MGNIVIITGASSGLGLALSGTVPFAARVLDISRSGPPPESDIEHFPADLSDPGTWAATSKGIARIIDEEQPNRSVLIHAAATLSPIGFAAEVSPDAYLAGVLLNSAAGQVLGQGFLRSLRGRAGVYDLVMISSGAASTPYSGWSAYGAGKAALEQWVRNVGEEQRLGQGVRVSAIAPGVVDTPMQAHIRGVKEAEFPQVDRFRDLHASGDLIAPEDAARRLWSAIESGLQPGSVIDLRSF